jgi:hypothetical protein
MCLRVRRQHTQLEMDRAPRMTTETVIQFDREPLIDLYEMRATPHDGRRPFMRFDIPSHFVGLYLPLSL